MNKFWRIINHKILALLFTGCSGNFAYSTPILTNGNFESNAGAWVNDAGNGIFNVDRLASEQKLTGWTIEVLAGSSLDWVKWVAPGFPMGTYSVELAGSAAITRIYQIFPTTAGNKYTLSYSLYSVWPTAADRDVLVTVKDQNSVGAMIYSVTNNPGGGGSWVTYTTTFTALSSTTYLSFENRTVSSSGSILDNISISAPVLTTSKNVYVYDVANVKLKAIPGQEIVYDWGLTNTNIAPDAGTLSLVMDIPSGVAFKVGSVTYGDGEIPGTITGNPTTSGDSSPADTGLTVGAGQISYSSVGTAGPWTYTPSVNYNGSYDTNVRAIKVIPSGTMNDGTTTTVGMRVYYKGIIP